MKWIDRLKELTAGIFAGRNTFEPATVRTAGGTMKKRIYGSQGRLEIADLDISVPLYDSAVGSAQRIVDNQNSAVFLRWPGQIAICDHTTQANFVNLNRAVPGVTVAVIDRKDSKERYRCCQTQVGHIKIGASGNEIFDARWKPVFGQNIGGLTLYTCIQKSAEDVMDIRLTYWRPEEAGIN